MPVGRRDTATDHRRSAGIDAGRFLAFVGVVLIHASDLGGPLALWGDTLGRFAVPMFFVVSGYFLNPNQPVMAGVARYSTRLLPIYAFWVLLYLVVYAAWPASPRDWAMLIIKGGRGNHLWFILSLWLCLIAGLMLIRAVGVGLAAMVALALYVVGLAIGSYAPFTGLEQSLWNPRDGVTFGLLPVLMGCLLRKHPLSIRPTPAFLLFVLCSALHVLEFAIVRQYGPRYTEFFIMTPLLAVSAFLVAQSQDPSRPITQAMAGLGRFALGFYAVHMCFINLCKTILPHGLWGWAVSIPVVVIFSVATTLLLSRVKPLRRFIQ